MTSVGEQGLILAHPALCGGTGLWAGFLDRLPAAEAIAAARDLEAAGAGTIWLPEYCGVDPFVRAALYLGATARLTVAVGVATIHARDPEAMVAVASTLEEAFPGRFVLGMGVSHRHLAEARGHRFSSPLGTMRDYLAAMDAARQSRRLPPRVLGAFGPRMIELAGAAADGVHTYFMPVAHTASVRSARWSSAKAGGCAWTRRKSRPSSTRSAPVVPRIRASRCG